MRMRAARRQARGGTRLARAGEVFMPWSSQLLLGIAEIDRQHHWLVNRINALHREVMRPVQRPKVIVHVLEDLVSYSHGHFIVEELLFERHGYPESEAHKAEHDSFTKRAQEWLTRFEDGEHVSPYAMDFLKDWLTHHICEVDRAYAPFLRSRGVG